MKKIRILFLLLLVIGISFVIAGVLKFNSLKSDQPVENNQPLHSVIRLRPQGEFVLIGKPDEITDSLAYSFVDSLKIDVPENVTLWNKHWRKVNGALLTDTAYQNLDSYLNQRLLISLSLSSDSTTAFNALVATLKEDSTKTLNVIGGPYLSNPAVKVTSAKYWIEDFLLIVFGLLITILTFLGLSVKKSEEFESLEKSNSMDMRALKDKIELDEIGTLNIEETIMRTEIPSDADKILGSLLVYTDHFMRLYGDFYNNLEEIPSEPSEDQKEQVLKQLIEMGLHSHSFHMQGKQSAWKYLKSSPNAQLLKGVEVNNNALRPLTDDPTKTDYKFRLLVRILNHYGIKKIQAFLRDEITI